MLIHVNIHVIKCYKILWYTLYYTLYLTNLSLPWIIVFFLLRLHKKSHVVGSDWMVSSTGTPLAGWSLRSGAWAIRTSRTSWARPCSWLRARRWPTQWGLGGWETLSKWHGAGSMSRELDGFGDVFGCLSFDFRGEGASFVDQQIENQETLVPSCPSAMQPWHSVTMRLKAAWPSRAGFSSPFALHGWVNGLLLLSGSFDCKATRLCPKSFHNLCNLVIN